MGENKHIKELDVFARKYVKEIPQEQLPIDFTSNLMQKIHLEPKANVFKTQALISKKGWFSIAAFAILTLLLAFNTSRKDNLNIPKINFSFFDLLQDSHILKGFSLSTTTVYAFIFFGLMIAIQFTYLKKYFDKRMSE
ncbi:hypothetical protein [Polaribacter sp. R77954]|uniref:hypothetical protein n=1 Tax=Polaribacter sp. R77954 TaxID=3093870 RepID=UPI0037C8880A